jgi:1-aminocyclopropane-1-carboxylate deaminase/D-cysteine desulfhydrase-like pyridoxal-dependent ACC family enzyme
MSPDRLFLLEEWLKTIPQAPYPCHSRIHLIKSFSNTRISCYIKRDDELGFGISGSKVRKYRTLIPYLIGSQIKEAVLIGSSHSNHILSLTQLLIENEILPTLFLRGDPSRNLMGNALYTQILVTDERMHWFSKPEWKNVVCKAREYAKSSPHKAFVIPEGGNLAESLPGAFSLVLDLVRNEKENFVDFDHIFIDSGTGFMAIALILGLTWLKKNTNVHVVLIAGNEEAFLNQLNDYHAVFSSWMGTEISFPNNFVLYQPENTKGFGKISKKIFDFIDHMAQSEGFLTDPIYSAKLLLEANEIIRKKDLKKNIAIMHSGGTMTLAGFHDQLLNLRCHR